MCGIAGIVDVGSSPEFRRQAVARMCLAMSHRGPDDDGIQPIGQATLGHRRLAVIDPLNGHQPMASPDGRFHIVFNGAVYNFRDLRAELVSLGYSFSTDGDTEVLLAAYARWGAECVLKLRGMFAFAIWDAMEATLFVTRDPFGIKPLYYRQDGARFVFASELGAFREAGIFPMEIDAGAIASYLGWLAVPAPGTIFRGVRCLRGGESLIFRPSRRELRPTPTIAPLTTAAKPCRSQEEFNAELRVRLEDTIRAHVIADVPVGSFLSGGLDSAAIVALMARATTGQLKTFSVGFAGPTVDETELAAATACHLQTEHYARTLTGAEVAADLPAILNAMDQPTGDGINTFYASQMARAGGVVAALSGLGGDELFGGYPSFRDIPRLARWMPLWRRAPQSARHQLLGRLRQRDSRSRKLADILEHARDLNEICALHRRVFPSGQTSMLLSDDARIAIGKTATFHPETGHLARALRDAGTFETISMWETKTYMADVLLRDSDVMSMRHSLELRVPFVDGPLIDWLRQQPSRFRDDRTQPKSALSAAVADLLPPAVLNRPKRGFTLPFGQWMTTELRPFLEATFSDASIERSGIFARSATRGVWDEFVTGKDPQQWSRAWSLAVLIDFVNRQPPAGRPAQPDLPVEIASAGQSAPANDAAPQTSPGSIAARDGARTLLLAPELFSAEGGIPRMLRLYLKALCDLADPAASVQFVALNDQIIDSHDLRGSANERLTEWRVCNREKTTFIRAALAMSRRTDRLICGHVAQLPVALLAKTLNPRLRYYLVAHGIEVWRRFSVAEWLALRRAERILCVSEFTRQELLRHCHLPPGRAVVLPNALDPAFQLTPSPRPPEHPPGILAVTRLTNVHRYKGVELLIEAMPAVRAAHPEAVLRIIGRGDDVDRLRRLKDKLNLQSAVQFLGYVDDARISEEMRRCSVFALPSSHEGFGLVFVEAMAHGRPCVGARAGGVPEIITPETGVLVEPGSVPAIADACAQALTASWDRSKIQARAADFSYPRFKQRLAEVLDD